MQERGIDRVSKSGRHAMPNEPEDGPIDAIGAAALLGPPDSPSALRGPMRSLLFIALIALVSCSSTASSGSTSANGPVRVTLTQWRDGQYFELVSDSFTSKVESKSRVEVYSTVRPDAQRKVQADEVIDELLVFFAEHGFDELSTAGHAPAPKIQQETGGWTIEVEDAKGLRFALTVGRNSEDKVELLMMIQAFFEIWNNTFGLQSVDLQPGDSPFKRATPGR